jgi:hypothetical protein
MHPVLFWLLTGLSLAVFAPCVLMPIWRDLQHTQAYEHELAQVIAYLEQQIERNEAHMQALRTDPLVNERYARRDLNQRVEGERLIPFDAESLSSVEIYLRGPLVPMADDLSTVKTERSVWLDEAEVWLPAWVYSDAFRTSPQREILLIMSAGLLIAAFVLFPARPRAP